MSCKYCDNAYTNEELDHDNDFSSCGIGSIEKGHSMFMTTGAYRSTVIEILKWDDNNQRNHTLGIYVPKYCPECGRELFENANCTESSCVKYENRQNAKDMMVKFVNDEEVEE